jgi:phosphohistidine phosphatase SixA
MSRLMKRLLFAALLACSSLRAATIIIVRHAERSTAMSTDAPLSAAGVTRAKLLAQMLRDAGVGRIFVTEVLRARQTAEPLAAQLHLTPVVIAQKDTDALLSQLRQLGENETVLVVGGTSTVPLIVERLGAGSAVAMPDSEYDRLTVLITSTNGKAHAVVLRYGEPTE